MDRNEFMKAVSKYRNDFGIVGWGDNHHLFNAQFLLICLLNGWDIEGEREANMKWIAGCHIVEKGLFARHPWRKESPNDISHDEIIGMIVTSRIFGFNVAELLLTHANNFDWSFDLTGPGQYNPNYDISRFIFIPAWMRAANKKPTGFMKSVIFCADVTKTAKEKDLGDTNGRLYTWTALNLEMPSGFMSLGKYFFRNSMQKRYPEGLAQVMGIYHGPNHPFSLAAPKDFRMLAL